MTQTGAITVALRHALATTAAERNSRAAQVEAILRQIWATRSPKEANRVMQNTDSLYDELGLPK